MAKRVNYIHTGRIALAELPPSVRDVQLKPHKIDGLGPSELWDLARKCHHYRSINLRGWEGVSVFSFRSLCLTVGASLETVSTHNARLGRCVSGSIQEHGLPRLLLSLRDDTPKQNVVDEKARLTAA